MEIHDLYKRVHKLEREVQQLKEAIYGKFKPLTSEKSSTNDS